MRWTRPKAPGRVNRLRSRCLGASYWALAVGLCVLALQDGAALATHSNSTIGLLAIDAVPDGNTATSLGPVNGCIRAEPGAGVNVDYVVDAVPQDRPLIGFEAEIRYDPALIEVTAADSRFLLAATGTFTPFTGQTDPVPDSDGSFRVQLLDTASSTDPEANVERGPGVLARLTVRAKAAGLSNLAIAVSRDPLVYPTLLDTQNELIFVDRVASATLAVGQDCPVEVQQPVITDMGEINQQIIAENPELVGGTPAAGTTGSPPAGTTAEGETSAPGESPGESPPPPSPTTIPCPVPPRLSPGATPTPQSPSPETPAPSPTETAPPSPTPTEVVCTPTPTPIAEEIVEVDDDSQVPFIAGALLLLVAGTTAAGSGWYLFQRSRSAQPEN